MKILDYKKLKTMAAVAAECGVSKARISQLCTEYDVERIEMGNQKMFPPASVTRLRSLLSPKSEKCLKAC